MLLISMKAKLNVLDLDCLAMNIRDNVRKLELAINILKNSPILTKCEQPRESGYLILADIRLSFFTESLAGQMTKQRKDIQRLFSILHFSISFLPWWKTQLAIVVGISLKYWSNFTSYRDLLSK